MLSLLYDKNIDFSNFNNLFQRASNILNILFYGNEHNIFTLLDYHATFLTNKKSFNLHFQRISI